MKSVLIFHNCVHEFLAYKFFIGLIFSAILISTKILIHQFIIEIICHKIRAFNFVPEDLTSSNNSEDDLIGGVSAVYVQVIALNFIGNSSWFANWLVVLSW